MKEITHQYAAYDQWANTLMVERLDTEPEEVVDAPVKSSFPSLRLTLLHIRDAECAWYRRLTALPPVWPAEPDTALRTLTKHSAVFCDHVRSLSVEDLVSVMRYTDLRGNTHEQPQWEMIMHCCTHSAYHRGQLVTIMRLLGLGDVPSTDLIGYQRLSGAKH